MTPPTDAVEYLADLPYESGFFAQQAPATLAYVAAVHGAPAPRPDRPFRYCELGCGQGLTLAVLAATHPHAEFHGIDAMPAHVEHARAAARAAGLDNLRVTAQTFAEALAEEEDAAPYDFITLHGVWSWVPEPARGDILRFLSRRLAPGGIVMASYNAMPGWAVLQPLRDMMQTLAHRTSILQGRADKRARQAVEYLAFLAENRAGYFATHPAAIRHVEEMLASDPTYLAHEYLTPHGDPFYFADVARRMRGAGLEFLGSALLPLNYRALAVPEAFADFMASAPNRTVFEIHRDFIRNTRFRYDLYAAHPPTVPAETPDPDLFDGLRFALEVRPQAAPPKGEALGVAFDFSDRPELFARVVGRLAEGAASVAEVHAAAFGDATPVDALRYLQKLVLAQLVSPAAGAPADPARCNALNARLVREALAAGAGEVWAASPSLRAGHAMDVAFALGLEAARRHASRDEAAGWALAEARTSRTRLTVPGAEPGAAPPGDDALRAWFADLWEKLQDPASEEGGLARVLGLR